MRPHRRVCVGKVAGFLLQLTRLFGVCRRLNSRPKITLAGAAILAFASTTAAQWSAMSKAIAGACENSAITTLP